jgi:hypothetical protein
MRKLVLSMALLVVSLAACKPQGSSKLEGRWRGTKAEGTAAEVTIATNAFATSTEIIAKGNQIAVSSPGGQQQATYFVDAEDKGTVVIHTDKDGATSKETFTFGDDGKTMIWRMGDGKTLHFQRVNQ